jgi:phosphonate transport system substrate-binding protein
MESTGARRLALLAGFLVALLMSSPFVHADWRDDIKVLRVGVMTGANVSYRVAQLEPFKLYLESRLSLPVEIVPMGDYRALIDAQAAGSVQYAIYTASAFAAAAQQCRCVEPIAVPMRAGGETGFHAVLISRSDGPIHTLADAEGKRLALAGADSVAGRLLPLKALKDDGIDPSKVFGGIVDTESPEMAISALLAGDADIAAAWSSLAGDSSTGYSFGALATLVAEGGLSMDQIRIVWQSPLVPFGPHVVRSDLPQDLKVLLSNSLTDIAFEDPRALDAVDRSGGQGFVAADASSFAPLEALFTPTVGDQ